MVIGVHYGLGVSETAVTALAVTGLRGRARVLRAARTPWGARYDRGLDTAVAESLRAVGITRGIVRVPVVGAVHPPGAWIKPVEGLPPLTDRKTVAGLVREGRAKFFVGWADGITTTDVRLTDGRWWAGAVDPGLLDAMERGCGRVGARLTRVFPACEVLGMALRSEPERVWRDAGTVWVYRRDVLVDRRPATDDDPSSTPLAETVSGLGDTANDAAGAFGAVRADRRFVRYASRSPRFVPSTTRIRWAAALAVVMWSIGLVGPGVWGRVAAHRAASTLGDLGDAYRSALATFHDLQRFHTAFRTVESLSPTRPSALALLHAITDALPDGHALLSFRVDAGHGQLVALAPRAGTAIAQLEAVPTVSGVEVVGPVTSEVYGDREVERFTVAFLVVEAES